MLFVPSFTICLLIGCVCSQFGGSTVVLLFQAGKVQFDADLTYNSAKKVETHVLMGEHNGLAL